MRPAAGLNNPTADEQFIEPGIAVGMDDATKVLQMRLRMLAFTIGRVEEQSLPAGCFETEVSKSDAVLKSPPTIDNARVPLSEII